MTPIGLTHAPSVKKVASIGLASALDIVNLIDAHVLKGRGGVNWSGASVYCAIFFEK